jgi:hypothetical protein
MALMEGPEFMSKVGKPIYPKDLDRVIGNRFFTAVQVSSKFGISQEFLDSCLQILCEQGYLEEWGAPECSSCTFIWPEFSPEDHSYPKKLECPLCNYSFRTEGTIVYEVFKVIKPSPG